MNEPSKGHQPASVAKNIETVIRIENEAPQPRSRSEAIADAIGGFIGTIAFVALQTFALPAGCFSALALVQEKR